MSFSRQQLHVFDLDGTLCKRNISFLFGQYLHKQGVINTGEALKSAFIYTLHLANFISIQALHQHLFEILFLNKKLALISSHVEPFLSQYWSNLEHPIAKSCFLQAKKQQHLTALFSSSPSFLVEPIAKLVGFDSCLATQYAVDKEGSLCHIALVVDGKKKAAKLFELSQQHGIEDQSTVAYSDGENDLPMLKSAGKSIVFHPKKRLLKHCFANDWIALQSYWSPL